MTDPVKYFVIHLCWHGEEFSECSGVFPPYLYHELVIDAKLATSLGMQPWSSPNATGSGSSSPSKATSDELVDVKLLLED